jgi:hypothetical protein
MINLNTLNILHIPDRLDRYEILTKHLGEMAITDYKLWDGYVDKHNSKKSIHLGHRQIVQYAKDNKLPYIIIAEDDITFFDIGAYEYYLDNFPQSFDLYFGMVMVGLIDKNNRIDSICSGMTIYAVHERFYDFFLSMDENTHIDRESTKYHEQFEFFVCDKFVATQNSSKSTNSGRCTDFTPLLEGRKLFKRN